MYSNNIKNLSFDPFIKIDVLDRPAQTVGTFEVLTDQPLIDENSESDSHHFVMPGNFAEE